MRGALRSSEQGHAVWSGRQEGDRTKREVVRRARGDEFRPSARDDHDDHLAARDHCRRNDADLKWGSVISYFSRRLPAPQREFPTKKVSMGGPHVTRG